MSRTKSTGLIKAAVRPKSDAGHAGWRPKVDMAASMQINGLRPAAVPEVPRKAPSLAPIYDEKVGAAKIEALAEAPVRMTAAEAREIHEDHERTERLDPQETPHRMTQPGLFDALGVKV